MTTEEIQKRRIEFQKDLEARRVWHRMMNYHYLSYKGISLLNQTYSKEVLESLGLSIHIPRTFMTIESIRPDLDKSIDISVKWQNRKEKPQAMKVQQTLKGEWKRSKADKEKAKAQFDALLYGSGYLLNYYDLDEEKGEVFEKFNDKGEAVYTQGVQKNYEGMRVKWLNPYYVIPDRKAKTYDSKQHDSPRRVWIVAIWDYDTWLEECKNKGYNTKGLEKGGQIEEFDSVKRTIDALYSKTLSQYKTRDANNQLITEQPESQTDNKIDENSVGVVYEYTAKEVNIYAGKNWTLAHSGKSQLPKKEIPIYCLKDYDIPGELEGVGEAEVLRWQQYEENKIHNLMYLQVILNTVGRYGIVEQYLEDPTEVRQNNPLKFIRLKQLPLNIGINDAIQQVNKFSATEVPLNVLNEVKTIGQMATGQTDYSIGANKGEAGTLGEANKMEQAGNDRIKQKIQQMEERGITPILESWLSAIPRLYTEELDFLLNDGTNKDIKFLPFDRKMNKNAILVSKYSVKEGVNATTLEDIFKGAGYSDVVFVSDLLGNYDITVKTSLAFLDKTNMIQQYQQAIALAMAENQNLIAMGQPPKYDTTKLTDDLLRQFSDIIEDIDEYKLPEQPTQPTEQLPANLPINQLNQPAI